MISKIDVMQATSRRIVEDKQNKKEILNTISAEEKTVMVPNVAFIYV